MVIQKIKTSSKTSLITIIKMAKTWKIKLIKKTSIISLNPKI
jgi:hypothetical protein